MQAKHSIGFILALAGVAPATLVQAQQPQTENVARIVVWQPKPGMARDFEEGYKRHLEWHRRASDGWTWRGWNVISGDRDGYFIDGSFSHAWNDFDAPVNPAGDGADNAVNVVPYADVRSVAAYEAIPELSDFNPERLKSKLLTFYSFEIRPGEGSQFEVLCGEFVKRSSGGSARLFLRPENGTTDYLLLMTADKQADLQQQAEFVAQLLESIRGKVQGEAIVTRVHTETARYRPDLSYEPGRTGAEAVSPQLHSSQTKQPGQSPAVFAVQSEGESFTPWRSPAPSGGR